MSPEYDKLFDYYTNRRNDLVISRIEGSINEAISLKYGIYSFPVVALFKPDDIRIYGVYQGKRELKDFVSWIEKFAPPLTHTVQHIENKPEKVDLVDSVNSKKIHMTEVTDEFDFVKRELLSMKNKIDKLENELANVKNLTTAANRNNGYSPFQFATGLGILLILIAAIFTLRRLLSKKGGFLLGHHKV